MTIPEVIAAAEGYRRREEAETARTLMLTNVVLGIMGGKPISMDEVMGYAPEENARTPQQRAAAVKARFAEMDWSWSPDFPNPQA